MRYALWAMPAPLASIQSEGDLEIVLLHETHELLANIISPDIYGVAGSRPDQNVYFHTRVTFTLFLVHLAEMFAEGTRSALIDGRYQNWSLVKGLLWFRDRHPSESQVSGLTAAVDALDSWLGTQDKLACWCPEVDTNVTLNLARQQIVLVACNTAKHHLLRLSDLIQKLNAWSSAAGYAFSPQDLAAVLASMTEEARGWMQYHSSYVIELLGHAFAALNKIIETRYTANPTNDVRKMPMPEGVTSDVFRDIYGSMLAFKRHDDSRILPLIPSTSRHFKGQYRS